MRIPPLITRERIEDRVRRWCPSDFVRGARVLDCIPLQRLGLSRKQVMARAQEVSGCACLTGLRGQGNEEADGSCSSMYECSTFAGMEVTSVARDSRVGRRAG